MYCCGFVVRPLRGWPEPRCQEVSSWRVYCWNWKVWTIFKVWNNFCFLFCLGKPAYCAWWRSYKAGGLWLLALVKGKKWQVTQETRHVTCNMWIVTQNTWHVTFFSHIFVIFLYLFSYPHTPWHSVSFVWQFILFTIAVVVLGHLGISKMINKKIMCMFKQSKQPTQCPSGFTLARNESPLVRSWENLLDCAKMK